MRPIGHVDAVTRFSIEGWVADQDDWNAALRIAVIVDDVEVAVLASDQPRAGLETIAEGSTGRYSFRHYFSEPLSAYCRHQVVVRVLTSDYCLPSTAGTNLEPLLGHQSDGNCRPQGPILLTTMGRSGSTALMAHLSRHPGVVVAGRRPYEVEMGCYYAYALRTLTASGDQTRSLRSDMLTSETNRFHIGFNPYFEPSFGTYLSDPSLLPRFINEKVASTLGEAFRTIILDYYEMVARDQGKSFPLYFAEKSLPESDSRLGIRFLFGSCREIVVVRDLRDAVCSFMSYGKLDLPVALDAVIGSSVRFAKIVASADPSIHVVRYEDFVFRKEQTLAAIARFLSLSEFPDDAGAMQELFGEHATTSSPEASIGRWRQDLTVEQLRACASLNQLLVQLGYEP